MNDIVTLAVPAATLLRLLQYMDVHTNSAGAGELAALAIDEWLSRTQSGPKPAIRRRGYQWKTLFLPEGTQLRAWNREGYAYAEVKGDQIQHLGQTMSPHQFICACKGISRSAWAEVSILLPDSATWKTAAVCRREAAHRPVSPALAATIVAELPAAPVPANFGTRLPRIPPIPTQARLQSSAPQQPPAENTQRVAQERRKAHRRAEDLMLD